MPGMFFLKLKETGEEPAQVILGLTAAMNSECAAIKNLKTGLRSPCFPCPFLKMEVNV